VLTPEDLAHLCQLARLRISEEESARLLTDLERILGYVESLDEIDATASAGSAAGSTSLDAAVDHFREDTLVPSPPRSEALSNAPQVIDDYFAVPTVVDYGKAAE